MKRNLDYEINYSEKASKVLKKLVKKDKLLVKNIFNVVKEISHNPHDCENLKGKFEGAKKIRKGNYRIIFDIDDETTPRINVLKIGKRSNIYKKH
ncbi:plasmid stabilization system protein [Methanobrevibacter filiformis]|uniref:Plasmid stabilization system protein n=1 Tax=Methanobrevibacter filiformis TaxID=55758 RepID=A0A166EL95_9EURY|nr:plasmid stabilization system protein [Methanobrevibacter filiformis]